MTRISPFVVPLGWLQPSWSRGGPRAAERGLSLVEILIGLALGLFLLAGIMQMLTSGRAAYRLSESQARLQESGRYAIQYLARELRSGRSGLCRSILEEQGDPDTLAVLACALLENPTQCTGAARIGTATPLGYSVSQEGTAAWLDGLPGGAGGPAGAAVTANRLRGDVVVFWGAVGEPIYTQADTFWDGSADDYTLAVDLIAGLTSGELSDAGFIGGRLAIITDCKNADIFAISNPDSAPTAVLQHGVNRLASGAGEGAPAASRVNRNDGFHGGYNKYHGATDPEKLRAQVVPYDLRVYFICCVNQQTGRLQSGAGQIALCDTDATRYRPALCRWSAASRASEAVVMDVADLRATYDGRKKPDSRTDWSRMSDDGPQTAGLVANRWPNIDSTRLELLVCGGEDIRGSDRYPVSGELGKDDLGYGMNPDKRIYETFSVTIANRARTFWFRAR